MTDNKFRNLELTGFFFTFLAGILFHFLYEFTEKSVVGILFGSVNGSIWEYSKVFALSYCIWGFIELALSVPYFRQFIVAKIFALYLQGILIIFTLWLYTTLSQKTADFQQILTVVFLSSAIACYTAYRITISEKDIRCLFVLALSFLFVFFIVFFCFSVVPPHTAIFQDPLTLLYGIIPKNIDVGAYFMNNMEVCVKFQ